MIKKLFINLENTLLSNILKRNQSLRNKHKGKNAFLMATGASLYDKDLTQFNDDITIGCNDIFRHKSFPNLELNYYVTAAPYRRWRPLRGFTHEQHNNYYRDVDEAFRNRDTIHFHHATMSKYFKKHDLLPDVDSYYFLSKGALLTAKEPLADITRPGTFFDGGLMTMIALAIFMGCKVIYLLGCGYTYSPAQLFHFFDCLCLPCNLSEEEMLVAKLNFEDNNSLCPDFSILNSKSILCKDGDYRVDYFHYRNSIKDSPDDWYYQHRLIRSFAQKNGTRILNIVPSGYESPVYEKSNFVIE